MKGEGNEEADPDVRVLRVMKSNYGRIGDEHKLRWQNGVFVATSRSGAAASHLSRQETELIPCSFSYALQEAAKQCYSSWTTFPLLYSPKTHAQRASIARRSSTR